MITEQELLNSLQPQFPNYELDLKQFPEAMMGHDPIVTEEDLPNTRVLIVAGLHNGEKKMMILPFKVSQLVDGFDLEVAQYISAQLKNENLEPLN